MSRKRLGRITPEAASRARDAAEKALAEHSPRSGPPIARMAAGVGQEIDAEIRRLKSELEAQQERADAMATAEAEGRVIVAVDLDQIALDHLTRDRRKLDTKAEGWLALKASLKARGQQTPVELTDLGEGESPRYGLISGLRRITALRELLDETGNDRFAMVLALIRPPQATPDKLIAMIEENEIRSGISFYERGRIAAIAAGQGIFEDVDTAVDALFLRSDRNRRYKIRSFATVFEALDDALMFPEAIGERLGLEMARLIREGGADVLTGALENQPNRESATEIAVLSQAVSDPAAGIDSRAGGADASGGTDTPQRFKAVWKGEDGARVVARASSASDRITLEVDGLTEIDLASLQRLADWLGKQIQPGEG